MREALEAERSEHCLRVLKWSSAAATRRVSRSVRGALGVRKAEELDVQSRLLEEDLEGYVLARLGTRVTPWPRGAKPGQPSGESRLGTAHRPRAWCWRGEGSSVRTHSARSRSTDRERRCPQPARGAWIAVAHPLVLIAVLSTPGTASSHSASSDSAASALIAPRVPRGALRLLVPLSLDLRASEWRPLVPSALQGTTAQCGERPRASAVSGWGSAGTTLKQRHT